MSIDYRAVLVVGRSREELEEWEDGLSEKGEDYEEHLEGFSPYYDSGSLFLGIEVASTYDYHHKTLDEDQLAVNIIAAKREFKEVTGLEGELILSTYGH